jgi:hypothetical protein
LETFLLPSSSTPLQSTSTSSQFYRSGFTNGQRFNAGAILFSDLVSFGWKFPSFLFSDFDERHLFDVEVKLKMGHDTSPILLLDVLLDFPVNAILQRVGLLETLLDIIGSVVVNHEQGMIHMTPLDGHPFLTENHS